jgi:predicted nucleic acid-binding protein
MLAYMRRTTVKIPDVLDARLRHEAQRRGVTISDISREALEAYLVGSAGRRRLGAAKAGQSGLTDVSNASRRFSRPRRGDSRDHRRCGPPVRVRRRGRRASRGVARAPGDHAGPLIVPVLVVTEVTYLLATRLGVEPEVRFLGDLAAGAFAIEPVFAGDWLRIAELVATYRDLPLGTVDASVVTTAERLAIAEIATVDRRHFGVVRPSHADTFTLLP